MADFSCIPEPDWIRNIWGGEEWFRLIRRCAEYGEEQGLEAWLYDEDRWPSGTCGGTVTFAKVNRMRFISEYGSGQEADACEDVIRILARYALRFAEDGSLIEAFPVRSREEVSGGYRYAVYAEEMMRCSDFYNGATYLDTMNGAAVDAFLRSTLDRYAEECGDLFGGAIKGVFTDEPHRGTCFNGFGIQNPNRSRMTPYTGELFAAYREKYGEELCIPAVYYKRQGEEENETAARYIDVLDDLFTRNFAGKYAAWCSDHGIVFTGHILHEDSLSIQTHLNIDGNEMRWPWKVKNGVYLEANLSVSSCIRFIGNLLAEYGFDKDEFSVNIVAEEPSKEDDEDE